MAGCGTAEKTQIQFKFSFKFRYHTSHVVVKTLFPVMDEVMKA